MPIIHIDQPVTYLNDCDAWACSMILFVVDMNQNDGQYSYFLQTYVENKIAMNSYLPLVVIAT